MLLESLKLHFKWCKIFYIFYSPFGILFCIVYKYYSYHMLSIKWNVIYKLTQFFLRLLTRRANFSGLQDKIVKLILYALMLNGRYLCKRCPLNPHKGFNQLGDGISFDNTGHFPGFLFLIENFFFIFADLNFYCFKEVIVFISKRFFT